MHSFIVFFRQQIWRHLRHPAIWVVIVLTMLGARFFIPLPTDGYVTLSINNAYPVASSGVIGLQLGIIAALLLTPLAYIYLKAGPTRIHPWQIEDVTPSRRLALSLGQGLADTVALWFILLWVGLAGIILCIFRLPLSEINPLHLFLTLFLVAGPAMIMVAGVKRLFGSRPWLRGAWGDVLFFVFWMAGNIVAAMLFDGDQIQLNKDIFGFAASAAVSTDETITALVVGGAPTQEQYIELDPVRGFVRAEFLLARLQWLVTGIGLFVLAAFIYRPRRFKTTEKGGWRKTAFSGLDRIGMSLSVVIIRPFEALPILASNLRQLLRPGWLVILLLGLSFAGTVMPFRRIIGPGIFLGLIFMVSRLGAAWEARHLRQFKATLPMNPIVQALFGALAVSLISLLFYLPAIISHALRGDIWVVVMDVALLALVLSAIGIGLGLITRSATFSRLMLLGFWYAYLNF